MNAIAAKIESGFEPIPGYFLRDKLGIGGYGEVWSADAPGGLKKAIKFVHGNIDDDRASSELRSLQRIRQVNHPFILSLERIEIVEGQLIIVSELAQGSLLDRFIEYRGKGFAGIPRDRLLVYLQDAADGLDFLCQKHELQHLDVKPGNLLLLSDRIKVADFGLVKDLQSMTQSMLGGLTPTYAAPEMFDGRPGRFSDQYSLAIVFQEMLTGTLPFRGRTTAQLANEHLNKAPILDALPVEDRAIIAKALSKKSQQRFSDCRELVDALANAKPKSSGSEEAHPTSPGWNSVGNRQAGNTRSSVSIQPSNRGFNHRSSTHQNKLRGSDKRTATRTSDSQAGTSANETFKPKSESKLGRQSETDRDLVLYIGLGGLGADVIGRIRKSMLDQIDESNLVSFLAIDTDHKSLEPLVDRTDSSHLDYGSVLHIPIKNPQYYRSGTQVFPQLSRRWVYNIPRSQLTDGVRPLGMLAFLDHAHACCDRMANRFDDLFQLAAESNESFRRVIVHIVSSSLGGTGSAIVSEIGFLTRYVTEKMGFQAHVELTITCASPNASTYVDLPTASSIGCLLEINHYFKTGGLHPGIPGFASSGTHKPPFDHVRLVYGGQANRQEDYQQTIKEVTNAIRFGEISQDFTETPNDPSTHPQSWLSTISATDFELEFTLNPRRANASLLIDILLGWLRCFDESANRGNANTPLLVPAKTAERMEFLINDLFRACGWNAQTWVRSCMSTVSDSQDDLSGDGSVSTPLTMLEENDIEELQSICESLGTDLGKTLVAFENLILLGVQQLQSCICGKWLTHSQYWTLVPTFVGNIINKLKTQTNSLYVVAQKLGQQHDEILDRIENGIAAEEENQEQLSRLFIESRFHSLSGRLLGKFVSFLQQYLNQWSQFSNTFADEILSFSSRLCQQELGMQIDACIAEKPMSRSDQFARIARSWVSTACVRFWDKRIGLHSAWIPDDENWPKGMDWPHQADTQSCFTELFDRLNEFHSSKSKGPSVSPVDTQDGVSTGVLERSTLECQTKVVTQDLDIDTGTKSEKPACEDIYSLLDKNLREGVPYLCEFGGEIQQTLLIPEMVWYQVPKEMRDGLTQRCQVSVNASISSPILLSIGTDLDLENTIDRMLMPTSETWQLVPRILSRVDVDWIPFSTTG